MRKVHLLLSFIVIGFLIVGTALWPDHPAFWLASGSIGYQVVRGVLMGVLFMLLVTDPPRHLLLRVYTGGVSVIIGLWAIISSYSWHMLPLDTLSLLTVTFAIGIVALEREFHEDAEKSPNNTVTA